MPRPALSSAAGSYDKLPPNPLLMTYIASDAARRAFVDGMAEVQVKRGEIIMRQGDKGNNYYLIKEGQCEVVTEQKDGTVNCVRRLSAGAGCGELSIINNVPRSATVTAVSATVTLLIVNKRAFMDMVGTACAAKRTKYAAFLGRVAVLNGCTEYDRLLIADVLTSSTFSDNEVVLRRDTANDRFWMVFEGEVVTKGADGKARSYKVGDHFGEYELFKNQRTSSTLSAKGGTTCVSIGREHFMAHVPLTGFVTDGQTQAEALKMDGGGGGGGGGGGAKLRNRRLAESAEPTTGAVGSAGADAPVQSVPKPAPTHARILKVVQNHMLFTRLDAEQIDNLIGVMVEHKVAGGTVVIREGEKGNHFYIVDSGECDAFSSAVAANNGLVKSFRPGDSFGELALMYNCPRTATVSARVDCTLWSLDRASFRRILLEENARKASLYEEFLEAVPLLRPLSKTQRNRMVDALEPMTYEPGAEIIAEGQDGTHFYVIEQGEVQVSNKANGHLASRGRGDYFGEVSLRTGDPTMATVTAGTRTKVVRMERAAFQRLLGPLDSVIKMRSYSRSGREIEEDLAKAKLLADGDGDAASAAGGAAADAAAAAKRSSAKRLQGVRLGDIKVSKKILGEGAFGKVRRVLHVASGELYALKEMSKADIISSGQVEHIVQESEVLELVHHPCIANKMAAFQTPSHLYMIMEFAPGGDLYDRLHKAGQFAFDDARIYAAQVLLALEHLHEQSIVHRDLKLENILVAADGALKLTDFGFAKKVLYRTWTLCGTPEYLAPEIVLEKGHNKAADYWALGVLLFEFLNGHSPFEAEDPMNTYKRILSGKVNYPKRMDANAVSLCSNLLQRDITRRYGNLKDGTKDIKEHVFYAGFDWGSAVNMRGSIRPPAVTSASFSDWVPAAQVCLAGQKVKPDDDKGFARFGGT